MRHQGPCSREDELKTFLRLRRATTALLVTLAATAALWTLAPAVTEAKKVKISAEHDKTFSFAGLKTWAWHPSGTGEVKVALTAESDPERWKARADPVMVAAIEKEMAGRGFTKVSEKPDLYVTYWILVTIGQSSQYMGQFLGTEWGLPPFAGSTTAISVYPSGTMLIDVLASNAEDLVWRGSAQAEIDLQKNYPERKARLEQAVKDVLKRFPPKK